MCLLAVKMKIGNQCKPDTKSCILLVLILLMSYRKNLYIFKVFEPGRMCSEPILLHMWRVFSYIQPFPNTFVLTVILIIHMGFCGWPRF